MCIHAFKYEQLGPLRHNFLPSFRPFTSTTLSHSTLLLGINFCSALALFSLSKNKDRKAISSTVCFNFAGLGQGKFSSWCKLDIFLKKILNLTVHGQIIDVDAVNQSIVNLSDSDKVIITAADPGAEIFTLIYYRSTVHYFK